jgi:hypothetical protein
MPRRLTGGLADSRFGLFRLPDTEPGLYLLRLGRAELGVQGECALPVAAGLLAFAWLTRRSSAGLGSVC